LAADIIPLAIRFRRCSTPSSAIPSRRSGDLTVDGIPGRSDRANLIAKGDDKAMLSTKQVYERILASREELGKKALIA
jgi:hypothetical protein